MAVAGKRLVTGIGVAPDGASYPWLDLPGAAGLTGEKDGDGNPVMTDAAARLAWARKWRFGAWAEWVNFVSVIREWPMLGDRFDPTIFSWTGMPTPEQKRQIVGHIARAGDDAAFAWLGPAYDRTIRYASRAPGSIKATACVQLCRYLANAPHGYEQAAWSANAGETPMGGVESASAQITGDAGINAFRRCGAMAMLAPYRGRRAAAVA